MGASARDLILVFLTFSLISAAFAAPADEGPVAIWERKLLSSETLQKAPLRVTPDDKKEFMVTLRPSEGIPLTSNKKAVMVHVDNMPLPLRVALEAPSNDAKPLPVVLKPGDTNDVLKVQISNLRDLKDRSPQPALLETQSIKLDASGTQLKLVLSGDIEKSVRPREREAPTIGGDTTAPAKLLEFEKGGFNSEVQHQQR